MYVCAHGYNQDTNGAEENVLFSEISSFQRLNKSSTWGGKMCPRLERFPQFKGVLTTELAVVT